MRALHNAVWVELERLRKAARQYGLAIAAWCAFSLLTSWLHAAFDPQLHRHPAFFSLLWLAESRGFAFALLTPLSFHLVNRGLQRGIRPAPYSSALILGAGPFLVLYAIILGAVLPHTPLGLLRADLADPLTAYIAVLAAAHALCYFKRAREQELEKEELQRALATAELQALQLQLRPHFLFNSLHGISTLMDMDRSTAKTMVLKLSSLLRHTLQYDGTDLVALDEELRFTCEYLDIERMRLGARLAVDWTIDPDARQIPVPQLILQPLVENAVRHGISCLPGGGWIEISARKRDDALELRVSNSIGDRRAAGGFGVGLRNTRARLNLLYSEDATFTFAETGGHTAVATISLPAIGSDPVLASQVLTQAA